MLVLSRKSHQEIHLPELGVVLTLLEVGANRIRIGVDAPQCVRVLRGELVQKEARASEGSKEWQGREAGHAWPLGVSFATDLVECS